MINLRVRVTVPTATDSSEYYVEFQEDGRISSLGAAKKDSGGSLSLRLGDTLNLFMEWLRYEAPEGQVREYHEVLNPETETWESPFSLESLKRIFLACGPTYKAEIEQDLDAVSPREDYNLDHIVCFNRRHTLSDGDMGHLKEADFEDWDELEAHLREEEGAVEILPVYMYDHGGIALSTGKFGCSWDSGQVGFIFMREDDVKQLGENYGADQCMTMSIETYSQYVSGDVWYYMVKDGSGEVVDTVGGFYGFRIAGEEAESASSTSANAANQTINALFAAA